MIHNWLCPGMQETTNFRTSPYPKAELRNAQSVKKEIPPKPSSLDGKMISPFGERAKSRDSGSGVAKSRDPKPESRKSSARAEKQDEKPAEPPSSQCDLVLFHVLFYYFHRSPDL